MDQSQSKIVLRRSKRKRAPVNYNYGSSSKSKRTRTRKTTRQIYIPEDIVRQILLKIPAEINYKTMTHVCTSWRDTILHDSDFTHSNIKSSTYGLIFHIPGFRYKYVEATTTSTNKLKVKVNTLNFPSGQLILSACNGLILGGSILKYNSSPERMVTVLNPITMQSMCLPPSSVAPNFSSAWYALGYAAASGEYKVVKFSVDKFDQTRILCEILTLGLNQKWRQLPCWLRARPVPRIIGDIFAVNYSVGNYIHCTGFDPAHLVSLDMVTETFRKLPYPDHVDKYKTFLVMEDKLTFVRTGDNRFSYDIWVLVEEEVNINGAHWMKLCNIDLRFLRSLFGSIGRVEHFFVSGWLKSMELLVIAILGSPKGIECIGIAYNIRTGKIHEFQMETNCSNYMMSFVKSLVRFPMLSSETSC